MEHTFKAYSKEIDGKTLYFVKKFSVFPEYENCPPVLESMGMHADFLKACSIAKVYDRETIHQLMEELHLVHKSGRILHFSKVKSISHSLLKNTQALLGFRPA